MGSGEEQGLENECLCSEQPLTCTVRTAQRSWQGQVGRELEFVEKRAFLATLAALLVSPLQSSSASDLVDHSCFNDAIVSTDRTFQYPLPQCLGVPWAPSQLSQLT